MLRWLHHIYADLMGYFWLPCPQCGRMFGGHETKGGTKLVNGRLMVTCKLCPRHDEPLYTLSMEDVGRIGVPLILMPGESASVDVEVQIEIGDGNA